MPTSILYTLMQLTRSDTKIMTDAAFVSLEQQRAIVRAWLGSGSINVFGIQFAGKDTQCSRLAVWLNGVVLGGGDIMRNQERVPQRVRDIMNSGELAPLEDYLAIVTPVLGRPEFAGRPLLLSAVGRMHGEEPGVIQAAEAAGHPVKAAVVLQLDEAAVWERWRLIHERNDRETRVDDSEEGLQRRIERFKAKTLPVFEFYRERGLLLEVDGSESPDEVEAAIMKGLYERALSS